uniref:Putative secreted protein n=1 Tax=Amblyomma cajennense TaxID=34607 RepID=A0A023FR31_AMBCJ
MNSLTSLTLLAFTASTMLLVDAYRIRRVKLIDTKKLNNSYFTEENCEPESDGVCVYTDACLCRPTLPHSYIRNRDYFFSPEHGECVKSMHGLEQDSCNRFPNFFACYKNCERKLLRAGEIRRRRIRN